jgi:hypothetical protein
MKKMIIIVIITILLLSSCQPTPESSAVQSKSGEKLMDKIMGEIPVDYDINLENQVQGIKEPLVYLDKHYVNGYIDLDKKITIEIDADVYLPVESKLPVAKIERVEFTQETVDRIINLFTKGKTVYETYLTIDMLEEQMLLIKQRIAEYDENENRTIEELEAQLEYLTSEAKSYDENLQQQDIDISHSDDIICGQCLIDGSVAEIIVDAQKDNPLGQSIRIRKSGEYISVNDYCENFNFINLSEEKLYKITIDTDEKEALDIAVNLIEAIGIADMALYSSDIAIPTKYDLWTDDSSVDGGYIFEFKRALNGVSSSDIIYIQEYMEGELGYSPIWKDEKMTIVVNKQGITDFIWQSPSKVVEILNDDVEIMSFKESIGIAMQQMSNSLWSHDGIINQTLLIDEITLNLARIKIKDSNDEYMLIPVWKFYGENWVKYNREYLDHPDAPSEERQCINEDGEIYRSNTAEGHPYLILNAIDGTIIDPYK